MTLPTSEPMTLYEKYINGEREQVYQEIYALGQDAFLPAHRTDIEKVLTETFERTAYNLEVIYQELKAINYRFKTEYAYNSERPLIRPLPGTDELLAMLDESVRPFGFVPLSLKMFYKIAGACNFAWDYETSKDVFWHCADPIQITSLDDLVSEFTDPSTLDDLKEYYEEDGFVALPLSADYLHKDNISGGRPYSLQLTQTPSIDGKLLYEEHQSLFIHYLRICFDNCGFSRIRNPKYSNNYQAFFAHVQPQLKPI